MTAPQPPAPPDAPADASSDAPANPCAAFRRGLRHGLPFFLVIVPFGMLFGVVGTEAGLSGPEVIGFSLTVFAGASQLAALQMMQDQAPVWAILATAMAVNLRLLMYSVAMTPHLGAAPLGIRAIVAYFLVDQTFALSSVEFARRPDLTMTEKTAYFFGVALPVTGMWFAANVAGMQMGQAIPPGLALDFAMPITFLALVSPMVRTRADLVAALVSAGGTVALIRLPYGTGLLVAAGLAMAAGVLVESRTRKAMP